MVVFRGIKKNTEKGGEWQHTFQRDESLHLSMYGIAASMVAVMVHYKAKKFI